MIDILISMSAAFAAFCVVFGGFILVRLMIDVFVYLYRNKL